MLVRLTIDVAVMFYGAAAAWMLCIPPAAWRSGAPATRGVRLLWTCTWLIYCAHVALAFHQVHHWSHAEAVRSVEEQSGFGEGIFASYFFTLLWTIDVIWWWLSSATYARRPQALGWTIHAFMAFIIFNGAAIFASGPARWLGVAIFALLGILLVTAIRRSR
jgi:hypothetical protein